MTALDPEPPTQVHGPPGEQCASCGAPLADDQRYCLNCGARRAAPRVPVAAGLPATSEAPAVTRVVEPAPPGPVQRLGGSWGVAALILIALGVGVVIGRAGSNEIVAAAPAPVIVGAGATGATAIAATPATGAAADEWPDRDGFTVQLGELARDGTDQAAADAAKAAATAKGATGVGVLDAGAHGLTDGRLVLYSGVYDTRKAATAAVAEVKTAYPDARVIEVKATSAGAASDGGGAVGKSEAGGSKSTPATVSKDKLEQTEKLSPDAFQKQSKKLPKTTALPGKPPPKDNAAPGGGSDEETIG